jgi:hypothetical protein
MKTRILSGCWLAAITLGITGCAWEVGSGTKQVTVPPTVGQQLVDLQKAKTAGAITDAEFEAQKAKLLHSK